MSDAVKIPENTKYEIRISVRQLVEFLLRSGDIDNRRGVSPEKAMQEGSRLHRMIQRSMGAEYTAEVPLKLDYETETYIVKIDGRADGIIDESSISPDEVSLTANQISLNQYLTGEAFPQITVDEIKCVTRKVETMRAPEPVHLAQAKVYAYIYAVQHSLPMIRVRMTYCNIETEALRYFFEEYSLAGITAWFEELMTEYRRWADFQFAWNEKRRDSIRGIDFPFPYREGQKELVGYVYNTILEKKKFFLEAPTGVGKTIATLYPSIRAMGNDMAEKIFYLTAKTITRTVANDTLDLLRQKGLSLKSITITAKEKICPLEKADCNPESCPYATGHFDRVNDAIYEAITTRDRLTREDILELSEKHRVCPFELSLDISLFADAIICDYNYVFDPHACLKRYFADGASGDYIFLVDEAHNLVDRGRDMFSAELIKEDFLLLKRILNEATEKFSEKASTEKGKIKGKQNKHPKGIPLLFKVIRGLDRCNRELLRLKRECEKYRLLDSVDSFAGMAESLNTSITQFLDEEENTGVRQDVLNFWFNIGHFLLIYERLDENYRIYCELKENGDFMLKLLCVNPRKNLSEAMAKGRSSILFSATLLPVQYYKNLLGGEVSDYEAYAKSSFNSSQLGLYIDRDVTSLYKARNDELYRRIAEHILDITSSRNGNYMVFFPSHAFLLRVQEAFERLPELPDGMEILRQEERMDEDARERFLSRFSRTGLVPADMSEALPDTLIGFCVLGGIFSEGIDLKEDALIGSIIIGTGLPLVCNEREIIKEFFEEKGFDYAYRFPGMNKVLQAAGRVIRTEKDNGIVALLDSRFTDRSYMRLFPREWAGYSVVGSRNLRDAVLSFWENR